MTSDFIMQPVFAAMAMPPFSCLISRFEPQYYSNVVSGMMEHDEINTWLLLYPHEERKIVKFSGGNQQFLKRSQVNREKGFSSKGDFPSMMISSFSCFVSRPELNFTLIACLDMVVAYCIVLYCYSKRMSLVWRKMFLSEESLEIFRWESRILLKKRRLARVRNVNREKGFSVKGSCPSLLRLGFFFSIKPTALCL